MLVQKSSNRGTIITFGVITLIIIIVVIVVDVVMYTQKKGLFKPFVPPPTPDGAVAPNGNVSDPNYGSTNATFGKAISNNVQSNMTAYQGVNPATSQNHFGYFPT